MPIRRICALWMVVVTSALASGQLQDAQLKTMLQARPKDRVVSPVDDSQRVVLRGQTHPLARRDFVVGNVATEMKMDRMILVLRADPEREAALQALIAAQNDPTSSYYHHWLTPQEFGKAFGVSDNDLFTVSNWLQAAGMEVEEIPASGRTLTFSGTAAQVESAFHTKMQRYLVQGKAHYANAKDPEIPAALATVVRGVYSLHDFHTTPLHSTVAPEYTAANGAHFLMPQDWVTIYDVGPLYNQGLDGTGQSIAVLGRVDVALSDVRTFRSNAGLPPNDPQMIINGPDPGFPWCDDELESAMDVEWAGAIAKNATIKFVTSQSGATDGIVLSAMYAVSHNVAPIVSLSYGACEAAMGTSGNAFWNATWAQAAAQGQTVFVSSGDSGAAGCDSGSEPSATQGPGVNGLCSSPYSTCVGGTQFADTYNSGQYWSGSNGAGQSSALGYIPEQAWNESSWSGGLWSGGGGASIVYTRPNWQAATAGQGDGKRDVPDVSMHASIQDAYVVQIQGGVFYASGTSAAAPSLASVMALVEQNAASAQGNANPNFYSLANLQWAANGAAAFHDVTSGNNSVPGVMGFNAGTGYDEATGLGSVDASVLVNHWSDASSAGASFSLASSASGLTVSQGASGSVTLNMTAQGGFAAPVTLAASGGPSGVTVQFSPTTLSANTPVTATVNAASTTAVGNSKLTITASGGGVTRTAPLALSVIAPTFMMTPSLTSATVVGGGSATVTITTAGTSGFKAAVALSVTGLPAGTTATFAPATIASPGSGNSVLTFKSTATANGGTFNVTVKAASGTITQTQVIALTVVVPNFSLTANSASATVTSGSTTTYTINSAAANGFSAAVALAVSGLPAGVTGKFSPASVAGGNGSSTLTLTSTAATLGGTYTPTVTGTGGGLTRTQALSLTVIGPTFTISSSGAQVNVARGGSIPVTITTAAQNGFKAGIAFAVNGLPKGVAGTFLPASVASPGNGSGVLTLKAATTATTGTATITVTGTGGGVSKTVSVGVTVQ